MKFIALFLLAAAALAQQRIVAVGTSITETIYALGAGGALVAVDNASRDYIEQTRSLPSVGAFRAINAEGIVALKPDLLLATIDAGPPEAILQIRATGIQTVVIPRNYKMQEVEAATRTIAQLLGRKEAGESLISSLRQDFKQLGSFLQKIPARPRVVFCGLGANMPGGSISGRNTRISEMIELAGGVNPVTGFEGFRPLTEEGIVAAAPEIIVMTARSFERAGGVAGVTKLPGVALTPAGRTGRIIPVSDMYFQGFGPGMGQAARRLAALFFPRLASTE